MKSFTLKIYDDGGKTADRYTAVFCEPGRTQHDCLGMSADPFHPQGVGQHSTAVCGKHLGKRVSFSDVPPAVRECIMQDVRAYLDAGYTGRV